MIKYIFLLATFILGGCSSIEKSPNYKIEQSETVKVRDIELEREFQISKVWVKTIKNKSKKILEVYLSNNENNIELNRKDFNFSLTYANEKLDCNGVSKCQMNIFSTPDNSSDPEDFNELKVLVDINGFDNTNLTKSVFFKIPNKFIFNYNWIVSRERVVVFSEPQLSSIIKGLILSKGYTLNYTGPPTNTSFVKLDYNKYYSNKVLETIWIPRTSLELVRMQ